MTLIGELTDEAMWIRLFNGDSLVILREIAGTNTPQLDILLTQKDGHHLFSRKLTPNFLLKHFNDMGIVDISPDKMNQDLASALKGELSLEKNVLQLEYWLSDEDCIGGEMDLEAIPDIINPLMAAIMMDVYSKLLADKTTKKTITQQKTQSSLKVIEYSPTKKRRRR